MEAALRRIAQIPSVKRALMPIAKWHVNAAGYRQLGLR